MTSRFRTIADIPAAASAPPPNPRPTPRASFAPSPSNPLPEEEGEGGNWHNTALSASAQVLETEKLELLEFLLSDFYAFATLGVGNRVEDFHGFGDPMVINYVDRYGAILLDWLKTRHTQKTFRKVAIVVPRECMKSTIITQTAPVFLHCHLPNIAMAISSATKDAKPSSVEFAAGVAKHWEGVNQHSLLPTLYGSFKGPVWRSDRYVTSARTNRTRRDPTLAAFSVQTGGTSGHIDAGWLDDPVTQEQMNRYGASWLEAVWQHYLSLGYVIRQDGILTVVMTRYGQDDLMGRVIEMEIEPIVRKRTLPGAPPGQLPDDFRALWHRYAHLAGWEVINLAAEYDELGNKAIMFPTIWPQERIDSERSKSPATVEAQLNNRPGQSADNPVLPHHAERVWFDRLDAVPPEAFNWITLQADLAIKSPSAKREGRGDYTVLQMWAHHDGHVYLIWSWRGRPTSEEFDDTLISALKFARGGYPKSRVRLLTYDKPLGLGSGANYTAEHFEYICAEAGIRCPRILELPRQGKRKLEDRIMQVAPFWVGGLVHLLRGSPCASEIVNQVLYPNMGGYDDDADAHADVFNENVYLRRMKRKEGGPDTRSNYNRWRPQPAVHGSFDRSTGAFKAKNRAGSLLKQGRGGKRWQ